MQIEVLARQTLLPAIQNRVELGPEPILEFRDRARVRVDLHDVVTRVIYLFFPIQRLERLRFMVDRLEDLVHLPDL